MEPLIHKSNSDGIKNHRIREPISTREEKPSSRLYLSGTPVKILKGAFKGCIGKIAACTSDGVYFLQQSIDCQQQSCGRMPQGPFLAEEFEFTEGSMRLP